MNNNIVKSLITVSAFILLTVFLSCGKSENNSTNTKNSGSSNNSNDPVNLTTLSFKRRSLTMKRIKTGNLKVIFPV